MCKTDTEQSTLGQGEYPYNNTICHQIFITILWYLTAHVWKYKLFVQTLKKRAMLFYLFRLKLFSSTLMFFKMKNYLAPSIEPHGIHHVYFQSICRKVLYTCSRRSYFHTQQQCVGSTGLWLDYEYIFNYKVPWNLSKEDFSTVTAGWIESVVFRGANTIHVSRQAINHKKLNWSNLYLIGMCWTRLSYIFQKITFFAEHKCQKISDKSC